MDVLISSTSNDADISLAKLIKGKRAQSIYTYTSKLTLAFMNLNLCFSSFSFVCLCVLDGLEDEGIPVYINCKLTDEDTKIAGKLVVDAKVWLSICKSLSNGVITTTITSVETNTCFL